MTSPSSARSTSSRSAVRDVQGLFEGLVPGEVIEEYERLLARDGCAKNQAEALVRDGYRGSDRLASPRPFLLVTGMQGYTQTGVIGLPSHGTAGKGKAILDSLSRSFADHLDLLTAPPQ